MWRSSISGRFAVKLKYVTLFSSHYRTLVKPDKIHALRVKYENFLEQDRKRKERNDYILGQLDKMRTYNTVALKSKFIFDNKPRMLLQSSSQQCRSLHYGQQTKSEKTADQSLLQDIMSKFILIPKKFTRIEDIQIKAEQIEPLKLETSLEEKSEINVENLDWTSKYDILKELKSNEKEQSAVEKIDLPENAIKNKIANKHLYSYPDEQPVKDVDFSKTAEPTETKINALPQVGDEHNNKIKIHNDVDAAAVKCMDTDLDSKLATADQNSQEVTKDQIGSDSNPSQADNKQPIQRVKDEEVYGREVIEFEEDDGLTPAYISYPEDDVGKPLGDIPTETEDMQYPIDVIDAEQFTPKDVTEEDGVKVNPEGFEDLPNRPSGDDVQQFSPENENLQPKLSSSSAPYDNPQSPQQEQPEYQGGTAAQILNDAEVPRLFTEMEMQENLKQNYENYNEYYENSDLSSALDKQQDEAYTPIATFYPENQYYYEGHEQPLNVGEYDETSTPYDQNYAQQYLGTEQDQTYSQPQQMYSEQEYAQTAYTDEPAVQFGVPPEAQWEQDYQQSGDGQYAPQPVVFNQLENVPNDENMPVVFNQENVPNYENIVPEAAQAEFESVEKIAEKLNLEEGYEIMPTNTDKSPIGNDKVPS